MGTRYQGAPPARGSKEPAMTGFPHPFGMVTVAQHRRADFQAQADRDRLARLVQPNPDAHLMWPDRAAVVVVVVALLLAAGAAVGAA
jgi:hypothetical protein